MTISFLEQLKQNEQEQYEREIKYAFYYTDFEKWTFAKILKDISAESKFYEHFCKNVKIYLNDKKISVAELEYESALFEQPLKFLVDKVWIYDEPLLEIFEKVRNEKEQKELEKQKELEEQKKPRFHSYLDLSENATHFFLYKEPFTNLKELVEDLRAVVDNVNNIPILDLIDVFLEVKKISHEPSKYFE